MNFDNFNIGPASLDFLSVNENELLQQEGINKIKVHFGKIVLFCFSLGLRFSVNN